MENTYDRHRTERVLSLALDLGKSMIKCGAEMNRVEETIIRIGYAYGMKSIEVFSVVSMITATVTDEGERTHTQTRRIYSYSINFDKLEQLNALSRKICSEKPETQTAREELDRIMVPSRVFNPVVMLGYVLASAGFAVFFGGTVMDAVATMPIAVMIYLFNSFVKVTGASRLFFTALTSALSGAAALAFVHIGFGSNADMIMIGNIMLLIPGLMMTNSVREMLCGDLMSGILRLLESVILALSIALGYAIPIYISGFLGV
ncbi:MAG: threonine/serine exporter family protein [Clostridia bacterium]|nr:threonine/serine exporter family protein [Clostridia bacterium]